MKPVVLYLNPQRKAAFAAAVRAANILRDAGFEPRSCLAFSPTVREELPEAIRFAPLEEALPGAKLLITFGGDGTLLHGAKEAARAGIPVLGVNVGSLGFLTELEPEQLPLLAGLRETPPRIENRMLLEVSVLRDGKVVSQELALNEAVVCRGNRGGVVHLRVDWGAGGSFLDGDRLIVSTPTGSTGYSRSAGGPVVEGTGENLILTPICPQDPRKTPLVLLSHRKVLVTPAGRDEAGAVLSVDGGEGLPLEPGMVVMVARAERDVRFLRIAHKLVQRSEP